MQAFVTAGQRRGDQRQQLFDPLPAECRYRARRTVDDQAQLRVLEMGFEIVASTPEQFQAFLTEELARWKQVIETGKITLE